ncbi:MAG: hypothetical protein ACKOPN_04615 [Prochlorococcaceae cyanobacterium]
MLAASTTALVLQPGQQLRFAIAGAGGLVQVAPEAAGLRLEARLIDPAAADLQLDLARMAGYGDLLMLQEGDTLDIGLTTSTSAMLSFAFVRVELDLAVPGAPRLLLNGRPLANSTTIRSLLISQRVPGFRVRQQGNRVSQHRWTVTSASGFYMPVVVTAGGDVFTLGNVAHRDQRRHILGLGSGAYAMDLSPAGQGGSIDFNDAVLQVKRSSASLPTPVAGLAMLAGSGAVALTASQAVLGDGGAQTVITSDRGTTSLDLGAGNDLVIRQGQQADRLSLGAGDDRVILGSRPGQALVRLGTGRDTVVLGSDHWSVGDDATALDRVLDFNPLVDRLELLGAAPYSLKRQGRSLLLSVGNRPRLLLEGVTSIAAVHAAIIRPGPQASR